MNLQRSAIAKRWSRLNIAIENGEDPTDSAYMFLWTCVKFSKKDIVSTLLYLTSSFTIYLSIY